MNAPGQAVNPGGPNIAAGGVQSVSGSSTSIPAIVNTLYAPVTTTTPIKIGNNVFPPGTYAVPQPTDAEVKRQTFTARFVGRYIVGPPRFSNQSATVHIYSNGKNVTSNQFLRGRAQVLILPPADPTASPTVNDPMAGRVAGLATLYPSNVLQSGNSIFLDLTNATGVASNDPTALDHGLPSHLAFHFDPVSGGAYSGPQFASNPSIQTDPISGAPIAVNEAALGPVGSFVGGGFVDIKYIPDAPHAGPHSLGSGQAIVTIQGVINTTGATYSLAKPIN
jgi:hypothetical protein